MNSRQLGRRLVTWTLASLFCLTLCDAKAQKPTIPDKGPVVAATKEQTFLDLSLTLPARFVLKEENTQQAKSPIPDNAPTTEYFRSYQDDRGQGLYFFCWDGPPLFERGPMDAAEQWTTLIGGEKATVSLTSLFFGKPQRVLVAHFVGPAPKKYRYMIYTNLVDKAAFAAILASGRFASTGKVPNDRGAAR